MPTSLLSFFILNKQGTRIGVWTWRMLIGFCVLVVLNRILIKWGVALNDDLVMWVMMANNLSVVLNRFDKSGPLTVAEATNFAKSMRNSAWHKDANGE